MNQFLSLGVKHQVQVIMTRWTVLIGAAYLVLYGGDQRLPLWQESLLLVALLLNLGMYAYAVRSGKWDRFRWAITVTDLALITIAVAVSGQANNDFFIFFFLVLMVAGISSQFGATVIGTSVMCLIYVALMYSHQGAQLWRETESLIRLPFLFGVGLFFGSVSYEARQEQAKYHQISDVNQKMAHKFHQVASDRDRTKALLEIGQLALTLARPDQVLKEITRLIQQTVRVNRCSMLVFNEGDRHAYLAASSDSESGAESGDPAASEDKDVVLLLPLQHYPELEATLSSGEVTELHPDEDSLLWHRVRKHLPKTTPFRRWLVVPIMHQDRVVGAFFLRDVRENFEFHEDERVFCKAAALMTAGYLQGCDLLEEMRRRSRLDGLTGLLNFMSFRQELDAALDTYRNTRRPRPVSLVMVDIDNLKIINDKYGHVVGNEAIREVGQQLARAFPMASALCRYGGDEFFALVPMERHETAERAERVLVGLEQVPEGKLPCQVEVSIGVASFPMDGDVADSFIESADRAMYLAKGEGGNRVVLADPGNSEGRVFEAVIAVNARRLVPGEQRGFRKVLDQLLRLEEQELDSSAVKQSLTALMGAVESKDPYTSTHSNEVSELTSRVCRALGMSEKETLAVEMGALVHDIGKIGVPDEVLAKPGKLTTRERMQIERHPEIGAQILSPLPALREVVPLVLHHHERWDGTGYPHNLKGGEIPLGAQIISLCDVWHALTSDRSYRPAFPDEKAREIILNGRGTEWRPDLVDTFLGVLTDIISERDQASRMRRPLRRRIA